MTNQNNHIARIQSGDDLIQTRFCFLNFNTVNHFATS